MKILLNNESKLKLHIMFVALLLALTALFVVPYGQEGMILFVISIVITLVGIMIGPISGLSVTLLAYFIIGSILFWTQLSDVELIELRVPMLHLFLWIVFILLLPLVAGRASILLKEITVRKQNLEEQIQTLVAIDPITGFDNEQRLLVELDLEFNRSKRYKVPFSMLVLRIHHLEHFKRLYGEAEYEGLLKYIAKRIFYLSRASDLKFRVEEDMFGLLLTNTPVADVEIVIEKLNKELSTYQLSNSKIVTISIAYGYTGYPGDYESATELLEEAKEQVPANVT